MPVALIVLQLVQVVILWVHDWVPLGSLNDVAAVRAADMTGRLIRVTLIQSVPYTIGLLGTIRHADGVFPGWLWYWLWISYGLLFMGELRAWWLPYLLQPEPERAARYRAMFGRTHGFLPARNGLVPNTLHCVLHGCTLLTLFVLAVIAATPPSGH